MTRRAAGRYAPSARLSATVICANTRRPSGTIATPEVQTRCAGSRATSVPPTRISPAVRGCSPAIALTSVDLPAPFGPTTATVSPGPTVSSTDHSAWASP